MPGHGRHHGNEASVGEASVWSIQLFLGAPRKARYAQRAAGWLHSINGGGRIDGKSGDDACEAQVRLYQPM